MKKKSVIAINLILSLCLPVFCGIKDNDVSVRIRTKIVRIRTDNTLKKTISLQKSG